MHLSDPVADGRTADPDASPQTPPDATLAAGAVGRAHAADVVEGTDAPPPAVGADAAHRLRLPLTDSDGAASARASRRLAHRACSHWNVREDVTDTVVLLTSELVTNAARYAPPPLHLTIELGAGGVLVSCADSTSDVPLARRPDLDSEGGRGLWLIEMLANAWGYEPLDADDHRTPDDGGKRVWFLVTGAPPRRPPSTLPASAA